MRRRDATESLHFSRQLGNWPTVVAFALAVTLHVALLDLSNSRSVSRGAAPRLIPVTLRAAGADGDSPASIVADPPPAEVRRRLKPPASRVRRGHHVPAASPAGAPPPSVATAVEAGASPNDVAAGDERARGGGGRGMGNGRGAGGGIDGDGTDQRGACVYCPEPHYPLLARARGWVGTVSVGLLVLADGSVEGASLRRSSGYGVLDEAAIAVARQSRFMPPSARGLPTPLHGRIAYRFELTRAQ